METKVCKIYKLFNSMSDKFYIGSTYNEIRHRLNRGHKHNFITWKNKDKKGKYMSSYKILEEVSDLKNIKWEEVHRENIQVEKSDDKKQMRLEFDRKKRGVERKFILKFKQECSEKCVNEKIPFEGCKKEWEKIRRKTASYKEKAKQKVECQICRCFVRKDNLRKHQKTKKCLKAQNK